MRPCAATTVADGPGSRSSADDVAPPWIGDDHRARLRYLGDQCRHRHGVDHDDAWTRVGSVAAAHAHESVRSRIAPLGVSPPLLATATRASGDLALARLAAQLADRLVDQAHAVGAAVRELAAVRVERDHAVAGDVLAAVEEVLGLADTAEAQRLQPGQAVEAEPVVQLGDVDIAGAQRRSGPQVRRLAEHLWLVRHRGLVPVGALDDLGADGLEQYTGGFGRSRATSTAETITATAPSHGTSQSYSPNGVVISRALR